LIKAQDLGRERVVTRLVVRDLSAGVQVASLEVDLVPTSISRTYSGVLRAGEDEVDLVVAEIHSSRKRS
jgi:hypothetical protein